MPTSKKKAPAKAAAERSPASVKPKYRHGDTSWFVHDRFGMFIHWGLYAAAGRHEWVRHNECISDEDYEKYFKHFDPDMFNPRDWAKAAKAAGMKYFVITTKHHEGFCLFDSKYTDYTAAHTKAGRDLLREIIAAFRAEGLRVGLYYSLIDWHHPEFVTDNRIGPYRNLPAEEMAKRNKNRDMRKYAKYMRDQVTELLTKYGKIDIMWFDFSYPNAEDPTRADIGKGAMQWESEKLLKLVRKLQPKIIIDDRLDLPGSGDIITPEQKQMDEPVRDHEGKPAVWEGCQTLSGSWGYHRDENTWKTGRMCIEMLIKHVALNGNLIMNVGPTSRGYIDERAIKCLNAYAEWMKYNSRSIYGCGAAPDGIVAPNGCRYTYNKETNRLYMHLLEWPFGNITAHGLGGKVAYAQFLHDGSEIGFRDQPGWGGCGVTDVPEGAVSFKLPVVQPGVEVPVIELFLK